MAKLLLALLAVFSEGEGPKIPAFAPDLTPRNLAAWAEYVRPSAADLAFEAIPWIPRLERGFHEASERGRPVLLWVMNGHPLGCT